MELLTTVMTYVLGFFWLFLAATMLFWIAAALFGKITGRFLYSGKESFSPRVIFQITTKYTPDTVNRGVESIRKSCDLAGFSNYEIWVVTVNPEPRLTDEKVRRIIVPDSFQTVAKFKARSLEFVRRIRTEEGYLGWVYYMDEENWISEQTVRAITHFAAKGNAKIASGPLVSHNGGSYLCWLGDSVRHSEGRINCLLHSLGYWPAHGDNLLVEFSVEKEVGWEFSGLTEDVQFTGHALDKGYRTGWHGGELQTVSATSILDFIKQRRRWFRGIIQCAFSNDVSPRYRLVQGYVFFSGLSGLFLVPGVITDVTLNISPFARMWSFSLPLILMYGFVFFIGCRSGFKDRFTAGLLCWFFILLEGIGTWGSIVVPPKSFDIIKKT